MYTKKFGKILAVMMSIMVAVVFTCSFTVEANAASKKTYYVPTKVTTVYDSNDGSKTTYVTTYSYFKNGLLKQATGQYGKTVYKRNKEGYATSEKIYDETGKLTSEYVYKFKKKVPVSCTAYQYADGKKILDGTYNLTYKKGVLRKSVYKQADGNYTNTTTYTKKGIPIKSTRNTGYTNYDKNGNQTTYYYASTDGSYKELTTYTYKYDKKGNPVSEIEKGTFTSGGTTDTITATTTYKYTYNKAGKITKCVASRVTTYKDGSSYKSTTTTTYKYKKIKVAKKFQKFMN